MLNSLYAQLLADGKQSNGGGGLSASPLRPHDPPPGAPGRGPVGLSCQPQRRGRCIPTSSVCNSTADHDDLDR